MPLRVFRGVGDLRSEIVALTEHFTYLFYDLLRMVVILGEDQRFRHRATSRENLGEEPVPECFEHRPDLIGRGHCPIELCCTVIQIIVECLKPLFTSTPVNLRHDGACLNPRSRIADLRADPVHVEVDVDAVSYGFGIGVVRHQVLPEERERLFTRSGR